MKVDFKNIIEYASRFPEFRMIGSRPIDVSRIERSGSPLDGPLDSFGDVAVGDSFGTGWTVLQIEYRHGEIDITFISRDGDREITIILGSPEGPSYPFDRPGIRIGYRKTDIPVEHIEKAADAFGAWIFGLQKNSNSKTFDWNSAINAAVEERNRRVTAAEPNTNIIERRPDGKVYVRVTAACQERCVFCFFYDTPQEDHLKQETDLDRELPLALEQIDPQTTTQLILTGGEPTLTKQFPDLLLRLLERGFKEIVVQTNGILTAEKGYLDQFSKYHDRVSFGFSLHAATAETSAKVTGLYPAGLDWFPKKLKSINMAVHLGYVTKITYVLTALNLHELEGMVKFCADLPGDRRCQNDNVILQFSMPSITGLMAKNRNAYPTLTDVGRAVGPALELADTLGLRTSFSSLCSLPPCAIPDGLRHLESMWYKEGPSEWWEAERAFGRRCGECSLKPWCSGISRQYLKWFGDKELIPFLPDSTELIPPD